MKHLIRLATACVIAAASLTASAQQARAEQVCETTWVYGKDDTKKICGNWPSGPVYGDMDIHPSDPDDWDGDQNITLQTIDDNDDCENDLTCHFSWKGRDYDLSEEEGVKFVEERFIPDITIKCSCTRH